MNASRFVCPDGVPFGRSHHFIFHFFQVLPVGPDKLFMRNSAGSPPPQSPSYLTNQQNSSSGYQSQQYRNVSSEINNSNSVTVKRAASFNPTATNNMKPWMSNRDEQPRNTFLNSMNNTKNSDYGINHFGYSF